MAGIPNHYSESSLTKTFAVFMALDALSLMCLVIGLGSLFGNGAMPFHAGESVAWTLVVIGTLLMTVSMVGIFKGLRQRRQDYLR
ncbi:MAG: hypothetical protein WCC58_03075 [Burkholderiales bacterium]